MKHSIEELYKIPGEQGIFTADAVKGINGVYHPLPSPESKNGYRFLYLNQQKTKRKMIFTYGEHTWFDTEEERDAYRIEQNKLRAEIHQRTMIKKEIEKELSHRDTEELKKILEMIKSA